MMIGVSLQFEEEEVCESVRSIPTVFDCNLLILTIFKFLSHQAVVFDIVS